MGNSKPLKNVFILFLALIVSVGCSNVPVERTALAHDLLTEPPKEFSGAVETSFRKHITLVQDPEINQYILKVSGRIFSLIKTPISIELISTTSQGYAPSFWVIPGGKIFVDLRALKVLHFENEIAAALALAWERSEGSGFRGRLIEEAGSADPDALRIWVYTEDESQRAIEKAISRIYKAGYDPRGIVTYFDRISYKAKMRGDSENDHLKETARRILSSYAPLLNPIVRTEDFYKMRKRLERL